MESYPLLSHDAIVHIALFSNLLNAVELRSRLVAASLLSVEQGGDVERAALDFAFIDANMIISRLHLLTAVNQALVAKAAGKMKTTTIHSEVILELEPGTNIIDSLKNFGLTPSTQSVIVVRISLPKENEGGRREELIQEKAIFEAMQSIVQGHLSEVDNLGALPVDSEGKGGTNRKGIRKIYKLNQDAALAGAVAGSEDERNILDGLCSSVVALKSVAS